jgi:Fe-S cluster assembly protein SufD
MNLVLAKSDRERMASSIFSDARDRLPGAGKVADVRRQAFDAFERAGLPHRRIEDWKYTDLRALMREPLPLAAAPDRDAIANARAALAAVGVEGAAKLVLVDGAFAPELSDAAVGDGISVRSLRKALEGGDGADLLAAAQTDSMIALNAAMATDGVLLDVADRAAPTRAIQIVHVATAGKASAFTRSHVKIGDGARVTLIESFVGAKGAQAYQVNDVLNLEIGDRAEVSTVRLMGDAIDAVNIGSHILAIGARARVNLFNMTSGGAVSRLQGFISMRGEGAELSVNGVNLLKGTQHGDTTLFVDHAAPNCMSREIFRAVVDERAHSVFQGRIMVRPDAQKTDAKMMTRALLLSDEAEADNKPELEIFADDVTCGHGATSGALDDSLLFYLRARGLPEKEAQALLIQAFVGEAIEQVADDGLREHIMSQAASWLEARR